MPSLTHGLVRAIFRGLYHPLVAGHEPGGGLSLPPVLTKLLTWIEGKVTGTQRVDRFAGLGDYPMEITANHCLTFHAGEKIDIDLTVSGDFTFVFEFGTLTPATNQYLFAGADEYLYHKSTGIWKGKIGAESFNFSGVTANKGPITFKRVGALVTLSSPTEAESTTWGNTADVVVDSISRTSEPVLGKYYSADFDGTKFTMSEGSGTKIYATNGFTSQPITTLDLATMWAGTQDLHPYNAANGWWEKTADTVKYPYAITGFSVAHPADKWNGSESKYAYTSAPTAIVDADNLEGPFFTDGVSAVVPKTQAEIEAYVALKESVFFCEVRGLKQYNAILAGSELDGAVLDCGDSVVVMFDSAPLAIDGAPVYNRYRSIKWQRV